LLRTQQHVATARATLDEKKRPEVLHGGDPANPLIGSLPGAAAADKSKIAETIRCCQRKKSP
jgi:hypothetical protein